MSDEIKSVNLDADETVILWNALNFFCTVYHFDNNPVAKNQAESLKKKLANVMGLTGIKEE